MGGRSSEFSSQFSTFHTQNWNYFVLFFFWIMFSRSGHKFLLFYNYPTGTVSGTAVKQSDNFSFSPNNSKSLSYIVYVLDTYI